LDSSIPRIVSFSSKNGNVSKNLSAGAKKYFSINSSRYDSNQIPTKFLKKILISWIYILDEVGRMQSTFSENLKAKRLDLFQIIYNDEKLAKVD